MTIKKLSFIAASMLVAVGLAASVYAVEPGHVSGIGPSPYGTWVGEYKYVSPFTLNGVHYTYKYVQVSGSTQAYCQQQFPAGVTITKDCTLQK